MFHQDLNTEITYPGAPYQMKKTPWKIKSPAPKVGENTQQVFKRMAKSIERIFYE